MSNSTEIFSNNWNVYQKILLHNYMHHRELGMYLLETLMGINNGPAIRLLDIGCGDASQVRGILQRLKMESYTGYDMSAPALHIAHQNFSVLDAEIILKEGDMQQLIQEETKIFNAIYSSFAIHHLQEDDKQKMFAACYTHLETGGIFVYTDVFRSMGQTRGNYVDEYFGNMQTTWNLLDETDKKLVTEHVSNYDFPAVKDEAARWLKNAGFTIAGNYDADKWHGVIVAIKDQALDH